MKSKRCPTRKHCFDIGSCENCDFGIILEKDYRKIKRLKAKNEQLEAENAALKAQVETLKHPNF